MKPKITIIEGNRLRIAPFSCETLGRIGRKTMDLTDLAGQHIRIWLDDDGTYSMDPRSHHYWQLCELHVPDRQYEQVDTGETDPDTELPIVKTQALPLDLTDTEILVWDLPV